eukprot:CAMPEP_0204155460 /NCGR_PEP_ID=MMETSP0361-20130328/29614_1 /ASSEMBLY_ACC=CAM_ASM_000343 /TAXON_ID=268821 /ORGANISM="Scrippsiella Hangoei, Strain SHTV-5" /LENGTH=48 /DNA_ID= /DNA_START= /DNA_END= /DNA_ORIENTATION=
MPLGKVAVKEPETLSACARPPRRTQVAANSVARQQLFRGHDTGAPMVF